MHPGDKRAERAPGRLKSGHVQHVYVVSVSENKHDAPRVFGRILPRVCSPPHGTRTLHFRPLWNRSLPLLASAGLHPLLQRSLETHPHPQTQRPQLESCLLPGFHIQNEQKHLSVCYAAYLEYDSIENGGAVDGQEAAGQAKFEVSAALQYLEVL